MTVRGLVEWVVLEPDPHASGYVMECQVVLTSLIIVTREAGVECNLIRFSQCAAGRELARLLLIFTGQASPLEGQQPGQRDDVARLLSEDRQIVKLSLLESPTGF